MNRLARRVTLGVTAATLLLTTACGVTVTRSTERTATPAPSASATKDAQALLSQAASDLLAQGTAHFDMSFSYPEGDLIIQRGVYDIETWRTPRSRVTTAVIAEATEEVTPLLTDAPEAIRTAVATLNQPRLDVRVRFTDIGEPADISQPSPEEVIDSGFTMAPGETLEEAVAAHQQELTKSGESVDLHIPDHCKVGTSM